MTEQITRTGRWGQDRRLEFIDFRLLWEGRLNRSDLTTFFRISVPQASLDLSRYQELAPDNLIYDRTLKAYVASPFFKPILASFDSSQYLNELLLREHGTVAPGDSFIGWAPPVASLPSPTRKVEPLHLPMMGFDGTYVLIVLNRQNTRITCSVASCRSQNQSLHLAKFLRMLNGKLSLIS